MSKIDPRLRHAASHMKAGSNVMLESVGARRTERGGATEVELLLRCRAGTSVQKLEKAAGFAPQFVVNGAYTVTGGTMPLDAVERLKRLDEVLEVESSRTMLPDLDLSRTATGAAAVHSATVPHRGAGVIVGIVDSGIDFAHDAFRRADGSSRILNLWDQGVPGKHPGVPYGIEYAQDRIDQALGSPDPSVALPHQDLHGHGTHVAGIAAGNGNPGATYQGIAPEADLIVVAYSGEQGTTLGRSARALAALLYIADKAKALGRPVAINLSQGMNGGGHVGETVLETGLDDLLRRPGVIAVKSAGNEQEWRVHAGGTLAQDAVVTLGLRSESLNGSDDLIEIWHDGSDQVSVSVRPPGSTALPFVGAGDEKSFPTAAGNLVSVSSDTDASGTGDTRVTIILSRGNAAFIQPGTWSLLLRGDVVQAGRFDAWIERTARGNGGGEQMQFVEASSQATHTISIPGTSRRIITVGSYVTRPEPGFSAPLGQISSFSSRGPTRYGLQKPEIAAPGEWIISVRSAASSQPQTPDEWHTSMPGTSMAAPHVTGAAALLLGIRPDLTCEQAKQILMLTANRQGHAASAPDNTWGNGKLDINEAMSAAAAARFPMISNVQVSGAMVTWDTDIPTTGALRFHAEQRHLELGKNASSHAELALATHHSVDLSAFLAPGRQYALEILAFSKLGFWTADDAAGSFYVVAKP